MRDAHLDGRAPVHRSEGARTGGDTARTRRLPRVPERQSDESFQVDEQDDELTAELERELTAFNKAATGAREERGFSVRASDEHGLVAGLTGWTWGDCAGISLTWVREDRRRDGWGGRLLAAAESVAVERGCDRVFVSSFTFQAPGFYERHGYVETARVEDLLVRGVADVWLVKSLPVG